MHFKNIGSTLSTGNFTLFVMLAQKKQDNKQHSLENIVVIQTQLYNCHKIVFDSQTVLLVLFLNNIINNHIMPTTCIYNDIC